MELLLIILALALALASILIAVKARTAARELLQGAEASQTVSVEARDVATELQARASLIEQRVAQLEARLEALQTQVDNPPPLALPRSRRRDLDDLREELRAAQLAAEDDQESP